MPDGETIELGNGVHTGPGNRNLKSYTDITLRSVGGYEQCILVVEGSAASPARGFAVNDEPTAPVEGITAETGQVVSCL